MKNLPAPYKYRKTLYVTLEKYKLIFSEKIKDYGITDYEKRTITIKAGMSKRDTFTTFLHEILHAVDHEHSIGLTHKQVYKLERALFELWVDNFL